MNAILGYVCLLVLFYSGLGQKLKTATTKLKELPSNSEKVEYLWFRIICDNVK